MRKHRIIVLSVLALIASMSTYAALSHGTGIGLATNAVGRGFEPAEQQVAPQVHAEPPFQLSQEVKDEIERNRLENLTYKGTKMIPSRSAPADELALQEEISAAFNAQDPQPPVRAKQFAPWLNHATYKVVLWRGEITKLEVSPDGSATVTVVIAIMIATPEGSTTTFTFDHAIETWQYKDGKLTFVESEAHVTGKWAMIG